MKKLMISAANKIIDKYETHQLGFNSKIEVDGHIYQISSISQFTAYDTGRTSITIEGVE